MRFLKVLGLLAIVAVVCRVVLFLIAGHQSVSIGGRYAGEIVGGALVIFLAAGLAAGIAAFVTRGRGDDFPGLSFGLVAALVLTAAAYANAS